MNKNTRSLIFAVITLLISFTACLYAFRSWKHVTRDSELVLLQKEHLRLEIAIMKAQLSQVREGQQYIFSAHDCGPETVIRAGKPNESY